MGNKHPVALSSLPVSASPGICSQSPQIVVSPTQTVSASVAASAGQMISAVPFMQSHNTQIPPQVAYSQALQGLPTQQIPNLYVLTTAGTRYQMAMGGAGSGGIVPASARRQYGAPISELIRQFTVPELLI